jgi:hypothetical protein
MRMVRNSLFLLFFFISFLGKAQVIVNAYASVTSLTGNLLQLSTVDEQFDTFENGEKVVIIQLQGAGISDSSNSNGFGSLTAINSAGRYEIAVIDSVIELSGIPIALQLHTPPHWNYNPNATVQVVTFPQLGSNGSFTTSASISCKNFNGVTGGVLCFEVPGNLFLQHSLTVSGKGFQGGQKSLLGSSGNCDPTLNAGLLDNLRAEKGQGIIKLPVSISSGRAAAINGGGGGVINNGGGGGGANYSSGGNGGPGYIHKCPNSDGFGRGAQDLQWHVSPDRIFMGGGGGGGHDNNGYGTNGGNGGGIIILKCDTILTSGSCNGIKIEANGADAISDADDGKGGGGAGGTIVLDVMNIFSFPNCTFKLSANGGKGGDVTVSKQYAGGGGGGQGAIMLLCGGTEDGVEFETKNGKGGRNMTSFSSSNAGDGGGVDDVGIFIGIPADTLPVLLQSFSAQQDSTAIKVQWLSTFEKNISHYEILKTDGQSTWQTLALVPANGFGIFNGNFSYSYLDQGTHADVNYYRLRIHDTLGCSFYSPLCSSSFKKPEFDSDIIVFPNPSADEFIVRSNFDFSASRFKLWDVRGREVGAKYISLDAKQYRVEIPMLEDGIYFLRCVSNSQEKIIRLMILR